MKNPFNKGFFKALARQLRNRINGRKTPLILGWSVTDHCLNSCSYCSIPERGYSGPDTAKALRIIDEASSAGILQLSLTGGEPLLRKDILRLLKRIKARGMRLTLNTSGNLPDSLPEDAWLYPDRIFLSIDGPEHIHDMQRSAGSWIKSMQTLRLLKNVKTPVTICSVITDNNVDHLSWLASTALKHNARLELEPLSFHALSGLKGNKKSLIARPSTDKLRQSLNKLNKNKDFSAVSAMSTNSLNSLTFPAPPALCSAGNVFAFLDTDLMLYPCFDLRDSIPGRSLTSKDSVSNDSLHKLTKNEFISSFQNISKPNCIECCCGRARLLCGLSSLSPSAWKAVIRWI